MIKKTILALLTVLLLNSCVTAAFVYNMNQTISDKKVREVEIGMNKDEVIEILGTKYTIYSRTRESLVLQYTSSSSGYFRLYFFDNQLEEVQKILHIDNCHNSCTVDECH